MWLADLPLADRLADAAIHAGAGTEARIVRAHALGWLNRGQEGDAVLTEVAKTVFADIPASQSTAHDFAYIALQRAIGMLWALSRP